MSAAYLSGPPALPTILVAYWCEGKQRFESAVLAANAAARREHRVHYRCKRCGGWHVGRDTTRDVSSRKTAATLVR